MISTLAPPNWDLGSQQPLVGMVPNPLHQNSEGLVAEWNFNDGVGLKLSDSSGRDNHGALVGPTWVRSPWGGVLGFDGTNDEVLVPYASSLDCAQQFAIAVWVHLDDFNGAVAGEAFLLAKGIFPNYNYRLTSLVSGGTNRFGVAGFVAGVFWSQTTLGSYNVGQWYFVVGQFNGTALEIYVDGQLDGSRACTGCLGTNAGVVNIGRYAGNNYYHFDGRFGSIAVYNRALTPSEIRQHYVDTWARYRPEPTVFRGITFNFDPYRVVAGQVQNAGAVVGQTHSAGAVAGQVSQAG